MYHLHPTRRLLTRRFCPRLSLRTWPAVGHRNLESRGQTLLRKLGHVIELKPYDRTWPEQYEREKEVINGRWARRRLKSNMLVALRFPKCQLSQSSISPRRSPADDRQECVQRFADIGYVYVPPNGSRQDASFERGLLVRNTIFMFSKGKR